jgi:hypothetical protein
VIFPFVGGLCDAYFQFTLILLIWIEDCVVLSWLVLFFFRWTFIVLRC